MSWNTFGELLVKLHDRTENFLIKFYLTFKISYRLLDKWPTLHFNTANTSLKKLFISLIFSRYCYLGKNKRKLVFQNLKFSTFSMKRRTNKRIKEFLTALFKNVQMKFCGSKKTNRMTKSKIQIITSAGAFQIITWVFKKSPWRRKNLDLIYSTYTAATLFG